MSTQRTTPDAAGGSAEADLRRERDFVAAVLDTAGALVVVLDRRGRLIRFNRACELATGYTFEEVRGRVLFDLFILPEERPGVTAAFARLKAGDFPLNYENYWLTRDGGRRLIVWSNTALLDKRGRVEHIIATGIDVTEHRQAEQALLVTHEQLEASEAALRQERDHLEETVADRVRELNCLLALEGLLEQHPGSPAVLAQVPELLVQSGRYPAARCARVVVGATTYQTPNFRRGRCLQTALILGGGREVGRVEVGCFRSRLPRGEEPFRVEELRVLEAVAERLGRMLERMEADQALAERTAELRASESRYRAVVENLQEGLWLVDLRGRFTYVNHFVAEMLGYTPEEMLGQDSRTFMAPEAARALPRRLRQRRSGQPEQYETEFLHRDGHRVPLLIGASPIFGPDGKPVAALGCALDMTEHRASEEALAERTQELLNAQRLIRDVLDNSASLIYVKDLQGRFLLVNRRLQQLLPGAEFLGKTTHDLFPAAVADVHRTNDLRVASTRKPLAIEEVNQEADGEHVYLSIKFPLFTATGRLYAVCGISTDITERKLAEQALGEYAAELSRSNRELQDFAYVASHDLQEPLRKIRTFSELLQQDCGDLLTPEGADYLRRMLDAARRMQQLIEGLLSYARVTTQAHPFVPVDLGEVAAAVVSDLDSLLRETGGAIEVGPLPTLEADALQMRQLLQNLLVNALKFHRRAEPPVVRIYAERSPAEISLVVEDNGIGFDERHVERIFGLFQRLHARHEYEGTGMGLAICRKIADRHRGAITATSRPGQGARLVVTLPVVQPKGAATS